MNEAPWKTSLQNMICFEPCSIEIFNEGENCPEFPDRRWCEHTSGNPLSGPHTKKLFALVRSPNIIYSSWIFYKGKRSDFRNCMFSWKCWFISEDVLFIYVFSVFTFAWLKFRREQLWLKIIIEIIVGKYGLRYNMYIMYNIVNLSKQKLENNADLFEF